MLARSARLRTTREIQAVIRHGQQIRTPGVRVHVMWRPGPPASRAACIVSTRVSKSAVKRHRYQRWLRQLALEIMQQTTPNRRCDLVLVALPALTGLKSLAVLRQQTAGPFKERGLLL